LALLSSHLRFITDKHWVPAGVVVKAALSLLLLAAGVFMVMRGAPWARHEYWVRQSLTAASGTAQLAALQKAMAVDPLSHEGAYRLGEYYRRKSWEGNEDYQQKAREAMQWFQRAMDLNPYDSYAVVRYGMCLHWLGRHAEAAPYFDRALAQDPNNYYTLSYMGWHYFQNQRYAQALPWLERSWRLNWWDNPTAKNYQNAARQRIAEAKLMPGSR
jgi:tetratricopeptide (TPR) repeat protein